MSEIVRAGTWVELYAIVLAPQERAEHIPADTKGSPLEMRVKGFLTTDAELGGSVEIRTVTGRRLRGTLRQANPAYAHGFGAPIPELQSIGTEARELLRAVDANK